MGLLECRLESGPSCIPPHQPRRSESSCRALTFFMQPAAGLLQHSQLPECVPPLALGNAEMVGEPKTEEVGVAWDAEDQSKWVIDK